MKHRRDELEFFRGHPQRDKDPDPRHFSTQSLCRNESEEKVFRHRWQESGEKTFVNRCEVDSDDDSLESRLLMFKKSSPYQRMFNPKLKEYDERSCSPDKSDSDHQSAEQNDEATIFVPPLQSMDAFTDSAVKV